MREEGSFIKLTFLMCRMSWMVNGTSVGSKIGQIVCVTRYRHVQKIDPPIMAVSFSMIKIFVPSSLRRLGGNRFSMISLTASTKRSDTRYGGFTVSDTFDKRIHTIVPQDIQYQPEASEVTYETEVQEILSVRERQRVREIHLPRNLCGVLEIDNGFMLLFLGECGLFPLLVYSIEHMIECAVASFRHRICLWFFKFQFGLC